MTSTTRTRRTAAVLAGVLAGVGLAAAGAQVAFSAPAVSAPTLTAFPAVQTADTAATFGFSGPAKATFACSLDSGSPVACSSPKAYTGLSEGRHTFAVTATVGKDTSSATTYSWSVDRTPPPVPSITGKPAGLASSTSATFSFTDTESGVAFGCSLDGGAYAPCGSPRTYSSLAEGSHTFAVRASDGVGNTSASTTYGWSVDSVAPAAPTLTVKPSDPSQNATNIFAWTAADKDSLTYQCSLENGAWFACSSAYSWAIRTDNYGQHQFVVRSVDPAGNVSAGTYYSFKYDKGLPTSGVPFSISGDVTGFSPGVTRPIPVKVTNPNTVGIYVTDLKVAFDPAKEVAGCASGTNFTIQQSSLGTDKLYVAAGASVTLPASGYTAPQLTMRNLPTNQDGCKATSLALTYSGTATN